MWTLGVERGTGSTALRVLGGSTGKQRLEDVEFEMGGYIMVLSLVILGYLIKNVRPKISYFICELMFVDEIGFKINELDR